MIWVILIFLFSAFFRLSNLELIEFKSDEATTVYQTVQFFNNPYLISRGLISGTGVYNFPLFNYLMIPLSIGSSDPIFISAVIAVVNSILVVLFFLLIKKYIDLPTATVASLLLAVSPWAVLFSRKIWAQDLINLLLVPCLLLINELILRRNSKATLPLFLLLTLLIQLHASGIFFLAITVIILIAVRIKLNIKKAFIGILIGLIPSLPYFYFQISATPLCPDCAAFIKYQQSARPYDFNNFLRPFQITSGLGYYFILGKSYAEFSAQFPIINLLKYIFTSSIIIILIGIFSVIRRHRNYLFLVIYFISIPVLYFITRTSAYMHYFVIIIPMSVILFSIAIREVYFFAQNKFLKVSIICYFLLFLISNIIFLTYFTSFVRNKKIIEGDYGPVYSITQRFVEQQIEDYKNTPFSQQLKGYAYIYAHSKDFHTKIGEFLLDNGTADLAAIEFNKKPEGLIYK